MTGISTMPFFSAWLWEKGTPVRIHESFRKSVLFLGVRDESENFAPYGTGFVAGFRDGEHVIAVLITAKHVLDDMKASGRPLVARVNTVSGGVHVGGIDGPWFYHPTDKKCDVALAFFKGTNQTFDFTAVDLDNTVVDQPFIEKYDVGCGDEVSTMGLLVRHFGKERNIPVVRIGNIAGMPAEPVDLGKFGSQRVYLIESRSIGGLSGSPVFLNITANRTIRGQYVDMAGHSLHYLLGINVGLFETAAHADRAPSETLDRRETFLESMSAGIAVVVPIQRALEIISGEEMMMHRNQLKQRL